MKHKYRKGIAKDLKLGDTVEGTNEPIVCLNGGFAQLQDNKSRLVIRQTYGSYGNTETVNVLKGDEIEALKDFLNPDCNFSVVHELVEMVRHFAHDDQPDFSTMTYDEILKLARKRANEGN